MRKKPVDRINGDGVAKTPRSQARFRNWRSFDPSKVVNDLTLIEELTTYRDHLDELLKRKGDYVHIKGRRIIGIFADRREAIQKAYDSFAEEPALVKQIVARERIHSLGGVIL